MKLNQQPKRRLALIPALLLVGLLACLSLTAFGQSSLTNGLVAYYPFDGNAIDASGNGYNGTNYGILPDLDRNGWPDSSFKFTGTTNWIRLNIIPSSFAGDFTITTWIKIDDLQAASLPILFGDQGCVRLSVLGSSYVNDSGKISFYMFQPTPWTQVGLFNSGNYFSTNRWYHLALIKSGATFTMYANGVLSAQRVDSTGISLSGTYLQVGNDLASGPGSFLHGNLDDLRIYNRGLSSNEVQTLFLQQPSPPAGILQSTVTVLPGTNVTFSASAHGIPSFFATPTIYQWLRNNLAITNSAPHIGGATSSLLTISNVQPQDTGAYSVQITNASGILTSMAFVLTVFDGDSDGDGLPNSWENAFGLSPTNAVDANTHPPGDQLTYLQKYQSGLNPLTTDTDLDGLSDYDELFLYGTNPLKADTDGDGIPDGWEVQHGLNPRVSDANEDADFDGVSNDQEYQYSQTHTNQLDPRKLFSQAGLSDYDVFTGGQLTNRFFYDRDDRLLGEESSRGISLAYQYDGNGNLTRQAILSRATETNGLPVLWRFLNGLTNNTSPYVDSDGDGWSDYQEWKAGSSPTNALSTPNLLGNPGTNIASLTLPFTPSNFVVGVGQLDGAGAEEIVVGADGNPGTNTNFLLVLTQTFSGWQTQRVDVGQFGITSIAVGQVTNRPSAGIYVGLRGTTNGSGRVMEFTRNASLWQSNVVVLSTNQAAFVLGVRSNNDLLASYATTNWVDGRLFSLVSVTNLWTSQPVGTNTSHRGLGTVEKLSLTNQTSLRVLDSGGIELASASQLPTNAIFWPTSGKTYLPTTTAMTWSNAQSYFQQFGGNLATVESSNENVFVLNQVPSGSEKWIGLYRNPGSNKDDPNSWKWVSGSTSAFRNWDGGQPDGIDTLWVHLLQTPGTWNDQNNTVAYFAVGEVPSLTRLALIEPGASRTNNWRGSSLASGFLRGTNGSSIFYNFADDKNANGLIDFGDDFVTAEYLVSGTNANLLTLSRQPIAALSPAQSYGLASVNFLNSSNEVFFTGEPDGQVFAWTGTGTNAMQKQLFSAHHSGKAWHSLASVKTLESGEGLIGLRVDPTNQNKCDLTFWSPQTGLPNTTAISQTAPLTRILPTPNSGKGLAKVKIRIWDAEGNVSLPMLQFQPPGTSNWIDASVLKLNGTNYSFSTRVAALPTGSEHEFLWYAGADLGLGVTNTVLLRARSRDITLLGDWSESTPYQVATTSDSDGDGLPDAWELANGLDSLSAAGVNGGSGDYDGDGFSNWSEYIADTNPRVGTSYLRVSGMRYQGLEVEIQWLGGIAATQYLERRISLGTNFLWEGLMTNYPPTAISNSWIRSGLTNSHEFYRIRVTR